MVELSIETSIDEKRSSIYVGIPATTLSIATFRGTFITYDHSSKSKSSVPCGYTIPGSVMNSGKSNGFV